MSQFVRRHPLIGCDTLISDVNFHWKVGRLDRKYKRVAGWVKGGLLHAIYGL